MPVFIKAQTTAAKEKIPQGLSYRTALGEYVFPFPQNPKKLEQFSAMMIDKAYVRCSQLSLLTGVTHYPVVVSPEDAPVACEGPSQFRGKA